MQSSSLNATSIAPPRPAGLSDGHMQLKDKWRVRILQEADTPVISGPPPVHPSVLTIDVVVHRSYSIPLFDMDAVRPAEQAFRGMNIDELIPLMEAARESGKALASFISSDWREAPTGHFLDDDLVQLSEICSSRPTGRFEGTGERGTPNFIVLNYAGYEKRIEVTRENIAHVTESLRQECLQANVVLNDNSRPEPARDAAKMTLILFGAALGAAVMVGGKAVVTIGAIGLALAVFEAMDIAEKSTNAITKAKADRDAREARERVHCKPDERTRDVGRSPDRDRSPPRSNGGGGGRSFDMV